MSASNAILQVDFKSTPLCVQISSFFFVGKALKKSKCFCVCVFSGANAEHECEKSYGFGEGDARVRSLQVRQL